MKAHPFGRKPILVVNDPRNAVNDDGSTGRGGIIGQVINGFAAGQTLTPWSSTGIGGSGITGATVFSASAAPAIPADIATTANAAAAQPALNQWATDVGCQDPVFPLALDSDYGPSTQEACALFQLYVNDAQGGAASPALTVDGLAGSDTWGWLAPTFGAAPSTVPATVTPSSTVTPGAGLSTAAKVLIFGTVGVGLLGTWLVWKKKAGSGRLFRTRRAA